MSVLTVANQQKNMVRINLTRYKQRIRDAKMDKMINENRPMAEDRHPSGMSADSADSIRRAGG